MNHQQDQMFNDMCIPVLPVCLLIVFYTYSYLKHIPCMHAKSCVPNAWLHMCVLCSFLIGMHELRRTQPLRNIQTKAKKNLRNVFIIDTLPLYMIQKQPFKQTYCYTQLGPCLWSFESYKIYKEVLSQKSMNSMWRPK